MKINELKNKIGQAINKKSLIIQGMEKNDNPQVQRILGNAKAQKEILEDILHAINGNSIYLNLHI